MSWHDFVTWVLNIRHLWNDMTVSHENWIWDTCDKTWLYVILNICDMKWRDMFVWHEYWTSEICGMTWLCNMSIVYQIFVTWRDMTVWHVYWISDICDMKFLCDISSEYQILAWHDSVTLILNIRFVTWHLCVTWVLNIRHFWHGMTWCIRTEYQTFVTSYVKVVSR